jgi:hypothetical protein
VWTIFVATHTWFAIGRFAMWTVMKVEQCGDLWIDSQNDVATLAAVAAVWSTKWFEFFAVDRGTAVSTVTSTDV